MSQHLKFQWFLREIGMFSKFGLCGAPPQWVEAWSTPNILLLVTVCHHAKFSSNEAMQQWLECRDRGMKNFGALGPNPFG